MGSVAIGALAALIGVLSGQGMAAAIRGGKLSKRIDLLESSLPELITRVEVQAAFQQVAQVEAQRIAVEQQQQTMQARRARQVQAFGEMGDAASMNGKINEQLASLTDRMNQLNAQYGIKG
ncbi:MAG: hypothetical protein CMJ39_00305 [Phycisphaerae bacterium]|nr:hypothetical protein [Phycisphaerae bacterium]|tara:strand:- start:2311 stop:2673 length:363 start_codon:yes stop_codon:yes gene_type:complete